MTRKFFGTDGIRGTTNSEPMTAETALQVGQAAGAHFLRGDHRHRVVIGKDTRLSGYMMESAMVAGFTSVGMDVVLLGPMPTPAVAMLTRSMRADIGVMISASPQSLRRQRHQAVRPGRLQAHRRGRGTRSRLRLETGPKLADPDMIGRARRIEDARGRYIDFAKSTFPEDLPPRRAEGRRSIAPTAPPTRSRPTRCGSLAPRSIPLGVAPNGHNINRIAARPIQHCFRQTVLASGADIGIALDGDADRLMRRRREGRDDRRRPVDGAHRTAAGSDVASSRAMRWWRR